VRQIGKRSGRERGRAGGKEEWEGERESRWERGVGGRESCNEVSNKYHSALSVEQE
jgi:hypothetical protein